MTLYAFLSQVKMVLDDENQSLGSHLSVHYESDKALISTCGNHALKWLALHAPVELLDGSDEESEGTPIMSGFLVSNPTDVTWSGNTASLPGDFVRIARVKAAGWHRALKDAVKDTDTEYLMMADDVATATPDRPVAVILCDNPKKLEIWPAPATGDTVNLTFVRYPAATMNNLTNQSQGYRTLLPMPPKVATAWVYLTAYFILLSWGDARAAAYMDVVRGMLGVQPSK